ncbi:MAG TPA: hypothetical protein VF798_09235, partial [Burkholderiaceae bacterium]
MSQHRPALADLEQHGDFVERHIGPGAAEQKAMLAQLGYDSMDSFIKKVVPASILRQDEMALDHSMSEPEVLE